LIIFIYASIPKPLSIFYRILISSFLHLFCIICTGDTALIATEKLKQSGLIYSLRFDMVINRLRFAKILSVANKLFGSTGVAVLEELAVHGRYGNSVLFFSYFRSRFLFFSSTTSLVLILINNLIFSYIPVFSFLISSYFFLI
jgi:hypothetical protein